MSSFAMMSGIVNALVLAVMIGLIIWVLVGAQGKAKTLGAIGFGCMLLATAVSVGAGLLFPRSGIGTAMTSSVIASIIRVVGYVLLAAAIVSAKVTTPARPTQLPSFQGPGQQLGAQYPAQQQWGGQPPAQGYGQPQQVPQGQPSAQQPGDQPRW